VAVRWFVLLQLASNFYGKWSATLRHLQVVEGDGR
jgi:hypothetical protein